MTDQNLFEFPRPIAAESVGELGRSQVIEATPEECERLAQRLGLDALLSLSAELNLSPKKNGRQIHLEGHFSAVVRQTCVVTLSSLDSTIEGTLDLLYDSTLKDLGEGQESFDIDGDTDAEAPPEPLRDGHIDVGEAVAEQLALEIDPFPRTPGVSFDAHRSALGTGRSSENDENETSPFAGLAQLKEKLKK
ncbi:MAG: DUF177 domain-containing protein [Rhodospirillales bacterium]|nr:DUF177 domain-containing protein [Rhodospirillales bacterium]